MKLFDWNTGQPYNSNTDDLAIELNDLKRRTAKEAAEKAIAELAAARSAEEVIAEAAAAMKAAQEAMMIQAEDIAWAKIAGDFIEQGLPADETMTVINGMRKGGFKQEQVIEVLNAIAKDRAKKAYLARQAEKEAVPKPESYGLWA